MDDVAERIRIAIQGHERRTGRRVVRVTLSPQAWRTFVVDYLNRRGGSHDSAGWSIAGVAVQESAEQAADFHFEEGA